MMKNLTCLLTVFLATLLNVEIRATDINLPPIELGGLGGGGPLSVIQIGSILGSKELKHPSDKTLNALARSKAFLTLLQLDIIPKINSPDSDKILKVLHENLPSGAKYEDSHRSYHKLLQDVLQIFLTGSSDDSINLSNIPDFEDIIQAIKDYILAHQAEIIDAIINSFLNFIGNTFAMYYLPIGDSIREECRNASDEVFYHITKDPQFWAIKMVDSWGKSPDGFFFGNIHPMGMYEECIQLEANYTRESTGEHIEYTGRYCNVGYGRKHSPPSARSAIAIGELSPFGFSYGTCIPSICTSEEMEASLNDTLYSEGKDVLHVHCHAKGDSSGDLSSLDKAMLSLIGIFGILFLVGTVFDIFTSDNAKSRNGIGKVFIAFSFDHNMKGIFTYKERPESSSINCLACMRVVTMTWIIIAHQYEADPNFLVNTFDILKYQDPVSGQVISNGGLSVDTFFFITGCVLAFRIFPHVRVQTGSANFKLFGKTFLRRFIRLSPAILFIALFSASLIRYLGFGPNAYKLWDFSSMCEKHWWKDPLFINNYILGENEGYHINDCLSNCWYTAVDMQLLLILPILLLPVAAHKLLGGIVLFVVFLGSILVPMSITIAHDLPPSPLYLMPLEVHFEYAWRIYSVPWCRAGPWIVGIATGILLRDPKISKVKIPKILVFLGYLAAIAIGMVIVHGLYAFNHIFPDKDYRDYPAINAAYGSLARPAWGICLAWVVFCCHTKNSDAVDRFLSYPGWRPLARMSYTMYLIAPLVQTWWATTEYVPNYYNYQEKLFQSLGVIFLAGLFALFLSCMVERPLCHLLNIIMPSDALKNETAAKENPEPEKHELLPVQMPVALESTEVFKVPRLQVRKGSIQPLATSPFQDPPPQPMYPEVPYSAYAYPPPSGMPSAPHQPGPSGNIMTSPQYGDGGYATFPSPY